MTCESCGVNEAAVHVTERAGAGAVERHLCLACAEKAGLYGWGGAAIVPADALQGRPIGRVLTKMGKLTR
jgi:protein-arginine kinase activator protein McsA